MDETDGPNRIYSTEHKAEVDTASIHSAVNKASKDRVL
jgi:hypothetical protein